MPLFGKSAKNKDKQGAAQPQGNNVPDVDKADTGDTNNDVPDANQMPDANGGKAKLVFHCQLAHGSPTGVISNFTNVKELYERIAQCYEITPSEIIFCTLNTHKIDMGRLLGGQIGLEDFIFTHVKGQPKVVDISKNEEALGLTITDNGAGYAFIKRIKEGSIIDKIKGIFPGDLIEKINSTSLIGCRHFEVAKMLKEIPKGSTFTMRLVEPMKSGFNAISARTAVGNSGNVSSGKKTLRLRSTGQATVEVPDDVVNVAVDKINNLLESFMGINDTELAQSIWEKGCNENNPSDFAIAMDTSELEMFGFTDDFIFDLWGAISDAKQGRLKHSANFSEKF